MDNNNKVFTVEEIDFKLGSFNLLASKRCSGKSVLVRNIIKHLLDLYSYSAIILFSETAELNEDYNFIDKCFIYKTNQIEEKLNKILKIQLNNIKKGKNINLLIILDDVQVHSRSKQLQKIKMIMKK